MRRCLVFQGDIFNLQFLAGLSNSAKRRHEFKADPGLFERVHATPQLLGTVPFEVATLRGGISYRHIV